MHVCTSQKCLFPDLLVIVVKLCRCSRCQWTFISEEIDRVQNKTLHLYKIMAGQQGQSRYSFGWPRASGKHDLCGSCRFRLIYCKHCHCCVHDCLVHAIMKVRRHSCRCMIGVHVHDQVCRILGAGGHIMVKSR